MNQPPSTPSLFPPNFPLFDHGYQGRYRKITLRDTHPECPTPGTLRQIEQQTHYLSKCPPRNSIILMREKDPDASGHYFPVEAVALLARDEFAARMNLQQGRHPERHEPINAIRIMAELLQQKVPKANYLSSDIRHEPQILLHDAACTYSNRFFSLLLENGLRPHMTETRQTLKNLWSHNARKYLNDIKAGQPSEPILQPAEGAAIPPASWPPDVTRTFAERVLGELKRMDLSLRGYDVAYQWIARLKEKVINTRQKNLLAELEAEANQPKKLSKSAKRKARQKEARVQAVEKSATAERAVSPFEPDHASGSMSPPEFNPMKRVASSSRLFSNPPEILAMEISTSLPDFASETRPEVRPADPTMIQALREQVEQILPTPFDREVFRSRVAAMKERIERLEKKLRKLNDD